MAELADAADSKSADPCGHGGSTPPPGTNKNKALKSIRSLQSEKPRPFGGCFSWLPESLEETWLQIDARVLKVAETDAHQAKALHRMKVDALAQRKGDLR